MPELDKSNLNQALYSRIVLVGNKIFFAENRQHTHAQLAKEAHVTVFDSQSNKPVVDFGGFLERDRETKRLIATGTTSSCEISGSQMDAEAKANEVLNRLQS